MKRIMLSLTLLSCAIGCATNTKTPSNPKVDQIFAELTNGKCLYRAEFEHVCFRSIFSKENAGRLRIIINGENKKAVNWSRKGDDFCYDGKCYAATDFTSTTYRNYYTSYSPQSIAVKELFTEFSSGKCLYRTGFEQICFRSITSSDNAGDLVIHRNGIPGNTVSWSKQGRDFCYDGKCFPVTDFKARDYAIYKNKYNNKIES